MYKNERLYYSLSHGIIRCNWVMDLHLHVTTRDPGQLHVRKAYSSRRHVKARTFSFVIDMLHLNNFFSQILRHRPPLNPPHYTCYNHLPRRAFQSIVYPPRKGPPMADSDDFGLSSEDEAELLDLDTSTAPTLKRKADAANGIVSKKSRPNEPSDSARALANKVLKQRLGLDGFRLKQETAIARLLDGESSVVIFPTGGGKSLCYQIPALCFKELDLQGHTGRSAGEGGITLVVSPLIALMKDQVDALKRRGISAAVLNSTNSRDEYMAIVESMRNGTLDIVYCAPERLNNEGFVSSMANVRGGVRLLAVDEAHCISEWGHAFRPDYLKVARFAKEIKAERVVCLTATATRQVAEDVRKAFNVPEDGVFRTTTYRPNLRLHAESYQTKAESYPRLQAFLQAHPGSSIVYVTTHKQAESLAEQLRKHSFKARHFHAGMKPNEKLDCQEAFMRANDLIMVATIAFGMGVDKANIRNVVHYDIPRSLEGYSQEVGRAGRDGLESHCMLYLCAEDLHIRESFARGDLPSKPSVEKLLKEVFSSVPTRPPERHIEASLYHMSKEYDIRVSHPWYIIVIVLVLMKVHVAHRARQHFRPT